MNYSIEANRCPISLAILIAIIICLQVEQCRALTLEDDIQYNLIWPGSSSAIEDLLVLKLLSHKQFAFFSVINYSN
jgi:hypothetical protein